MTMAAAAAAAVTFITNISSCKTPRPPTQTTDVLRARTKAARGGLSQAEDVRLHETCALEVQIVFL